MPPVTKGTLPAFLTGHPCALRVGSPRQGGCDPRGVCLCQVLGPAPWVRSESGCGGPGHRGRGEVLFSSKETQQGAPGGWVNESVQEAADTASGAAELTWPHLYPHPNIYNILTTTATLDYWQLLRRVEIQN